MTTTRSPRRSRSLLSSLLSVALVAATLVILAPISGSTTTTASAATTYDLTATKRYTAVYLKWKGSSTTTYQVQYSYSSSFSSPHKYTTTGTSRMFNRLSPKHTYYFRVRATGTSAWSNVVHKTPTRPSTFQNNAVQKASVISTDEVGRSSMDLSWATPSGQFACFRIQVSPTPTGGQPPVQCTTVYTLEGLKRNTTYTIKMYTVAPAETVNGIKWPDIDLTGPSKSITRTTSNYDLVAPSDFTMTEQHADRVTFTWTAPASPSPASTDKYLVRFGDNEALKKEPFTAGKTSVSNTSITITDLSENHAYYARVWVIDENGNQISDASDYVLAKTLIKRGTISGKITGPPVSHVVAVAYLDGELVAQTDLNSDGTYSLAVRPASGYKVRATYIGGGNYYSSWVSSTASPAVTSGEATPFTVSYEKNTNAGTTALGTGSTISGTVVNSAGNSVSGATVSLLTGSTGDHEVLGSVFSNDGSFTIKGVPDGDYRLRVKYIGSSTYPAATTVGIHMAGSDVTKKVVLVG